MPNVRIIPALLAVALLPAGSPAHAKPAHKQALAEYFGGMLAKKLVDCRACHEQDKADHDPLAADKPHNAFGKRLADVKAELRKAGKKTDIAARLEAIFEQDSDGDGFTDLDELLLGRYPGERDDKPTPAETGRAGELREALTRSRTGYRWSPFTAVVRPPVPAVKNAGWVRNPIDAFIAAEQEARGLSPRGEAGKALLLRRAYIDLIGLPPTPDELAAFLADNAPDAYEKVVDRLLADPRYGQRWGRHWMDVWRYSDWAGFGAQIRDSQPHIWRWRDWIVETVNKDVGYDAMVRLMLAADEIAPTDEDALRATGYLVRNWKLLSREKWMQDTVEHTFQAFLGVTMTCARCHDHMYDPLLQKEYYQVRAFFEPHNVRTDRLPGRPDTAKDGLVRAYDATLDAKTVLFHRGDDRYPDKTALAPAVPEALGGRLRAIEPVKLPLYASSPDKRDFVIAETLAAALAEVRKAEAARDAARKAERAAIAAAGSPKAEKMAGEKAPPDKVPVEKAAPAGSAEKAIEAATLADLDFLAAKARHAALVHTLTAEKLEDAGKANSDEWKKAATEALRLQREAASASARRNLIAANAAHTAARGGAAKTDAKKTEKALADAVKAAEKAEVDLQAPPGTGYTKRATKDFPRTSTGRRTALAEWMTDPANPLAARVAVNHIWLRHFGAGIVPTPGDFGRNARPPSHPALLDWLAAEFTARGWSMKAIHRLMVTSATYRQASTPDEKCYAIDQDNVYLWRANARRLEAEAVRDAIFFVAGKLDMSFGGPEIDHALGMTSPRRSLYFRHAQEKQMEFLKIFDTASVTECTMRKQSILPQQALALANSDLALRMARITARAIAAKTGDDAEAFVRAAFARMLSRSPTTEELSECVRFLAERTSRYAELKGAPTADPEGKAPSPDPAGRARENLIHVLLNHNDFMTVR
jgi:hypothetical protein